MQHLIKKQVLELKLLTEKDMFSIQQHASQFYYSHILPALEKAFDCLTDAEHVLQVDHLEIDLGNIEWQQHSKQLNIDELGLTIDTAVKEISRQKTNQKYAQTRGVVISEEKTVAQHAGDQWLSYMQNGYLPWHTLTTGEAWLVQVLEWLATDYHFVAAARKLIATNANALQRLVHDHPVSFLVKFAEVITATQQQSLPQLVDEIVQLRSPHQYNALLVTDKPPQANADTVWQQMLKAIAAGASVPAIASKMKTNQAKETVTEKNNAPKNQDAQVEQKTSDTELPGEGIFAGHAGLILLHPFFKSLFTHTAIIEGNDFAGRYAQEKAIWLLHYIATGNTEAEENQLVVPKLLCNYPLEQSPKLIKLEEADKKEAEDMMAAAIAQWAIVKNTSADGLREGFLQRSGKLYSKNNNLCFAVESHAIDVLLDHLPWNISMVKLPWIAQLITVEWR